MDDCIGWANAMGRLYSFAAPFVVFFVKCFIYENYVTSAGWLRGE